MNETALPITGGCLCGFVRYEATAAPFRTDYCYCRMCQKSSGSVVTCWIDIKPEQFRCTHGDITYFRSSDHAERGFCARCGSSLVQRAFNGDWVALTIGSLDRPHEFPPTDQHCGIESKPPWLKIEDDLPRRTTMEAMGYEVES